MSLGTNLYGSILLNKSLLGRRRCFSSKRPTTIRDDQARDNPQEPISKQRIGAKLSDGEKREFLVNTLLDLKDSKDAVYATLDAWAAWENNFPLVSLKRALLVLEKKEEWHRIIQVIKWMLSKGQGNTVGTYQQLIRALEKDHRPEEAHRMWEKKIGNDLHSVPWQFIELMISIYYRNNMLDRLVKLFKGLESYDRRPPRKSIAQKVADAYEQLGLLDEKKKVLENYSDLFSEAPQRNYKKSGRGSWNKNKKPAVKKKIVKFADENMEAISDLSEEDFIETA